MGDFATDSALSTGETATSAAPSVPPQAFRARWAAVAGERACLAFLPSQVRTA
jgi:hypothetical protein